MLSKTKGGLDLVTIVLGHSVHPLVMKVKFYTESAANAGEDRGRGETASSGWIRDSQNILTSGT